MLKIYRIKDWWKIVGLTLISNLGNELLEILGSLAISSLLLAFAFAINEYYDKKLYKKQNLMIPVLPLLTATPLIMTQNLFVIVTCFSFVLLFYFYSSPPLRLKRVPFLDFGINAVGLGILPYLINPAAKFVSIDYFIIINMFFYMSYSELLHQLAHFEEDKKERVKSIPQVVGIKNTKKAVTIILFISLILNTMFSLFIPYFIFITALLIMRAFRFSRSHHKTSWLRTNSYGFGEGILSLVIKFLSLS